jgi:XTP/dITP diphosphohydrolase
MRISNQIVLASTNLSKYQEMKALLSSYPELELIRANDVLRNADKIGAVETFDTYAQNAAAKARLVNQGCHFPAIADDSGLEVLALEKRPGVHSARYSKLSGYPSQLSQDRANVELLLNELREKPNREARFVCHLALVIEGMIVTAEGTLEGTITKSPRGEMGFGYDPVFIPRGESRTLAEMTETEKNRLSHRATALAELMETVRATGIQFART